MYGKCFQERGKEGRGTWTRGGIRITSLLSRLHAGPWFFGAYIVELCQKWIRLNSSGQRLLICYEWTKSLELFSDILIVRQQIYMFVCDAYFEQVWEQEEAGDCWGGVTLECSGDPLTFFFQPPATTASVSHWSLVLVIQVQVNEDGQFCQPILRICTFVTYTIATSPWLKYYWLGDV